MSTVIKAEGLSKAYQLGDFGTGTISRDIERFLARWRGKEDPFLKLGEVNDRTLKGSSDVVWSLKDLSFEIRQGDAVGIIGRNGAGKSTLLKLLSRVTSPTSGTIKVKGRVASLLEVGTGFHPELTGRENIYLNGAILGMRKAEITKKMDEIVHFSGVDRYIDTPVKRYSSGMYVRLAFAVAAHLESEILIVDEVLAVGDVEFQRKCLGKMGSISKGEGRTVLFVSHNMGSILQLCNKGMLLNNGLLVADKTIREAVDAYTRLGQSGDDILRLDNRNDHAYFNEVFMYDQAHTIKREFLHDEPIKIQFDITVVHMEQSYSVFVTILDKNKKRVFSTEQPLRQGQEKYELTINPYFLVRGQYSLHCFIHQPRVRQIAVIEDQCQFTVLDNQSAFAIHGDYDYGSVFGNCAWQEVS